jgi:hypothetical protein
MKRPYFFVLFFVFISCKNETSIRSYDNDVQAIIVANIKETIGIGDSAKLAYRFPPPIDEFNNPNYKRYYDSIKSILDTADAFITLIDSFAQTHPGKTEDIRGVQMIYHGDPAVHDLITAIISDSISKDPFDIKGISDSTRLHIKTGRLKEMNDIRSIAGFSFSRIAFDQHRMKAVVYMQYFCGGKCGYGELRVLEKKSGIWSVTGKKRTWIS